MCELYTSPPSWEPLKGSDDRARVAMPMFRPQFVFQTSRLHDVVWNNAESTPNIKCASGAQGKRDNVTPSSRTALT